MDAAEQSSRTQERSDLGTVSSLSFVFLSVPVLPGTAGHG